MLPSSIFFIRIKTMKNKISGIIRAAANVIEDLKELEMEDQLLSTEEKKTLQSMIIYWEEVAGLDDQTPLMAELGQVQMMLGVRLLWIVKAYVEQYPPTS